MLIFYKKILKIFFIVIFILILAELVLRIVSWLYCIWYGVIARPQKSFDTKIFNIICVGESTTYGFPIHGNGYPEQLERLLNTNFPNRKFKIYNLGVCAVTSSEIARHFYKNIIDYKPKLAIILVGNNNQDYPEWEHLYKKNRFVYYIVDKLYPLKILNIVNFVYRVAQGYVNQTLIIQRLYSDIYLHYNRPNYGYSLEFVDKHNLEYMLDIALKYKCKILICNYFSSPANDFLRRFAAANNIPFCDNENSFREWTGLKQELISEDGWHPSLKGYSVMAQNIYNTMLKHGLINQN